MNNLVLIGKIYTELEKLDNGMYEFKIVVQRSTEDDNGIHHTDVIPCRIYRNTAEKCYTYINNSKGNIIGVKGSLQSDGDNLYVFVDKVTFLCEKKVEE